MSPPALPSVPPPSPPPPPSSSPLLATGRCQCGDSHPYCHANGWCYQSSTSPLWDYSCEGGCETQPPDKPSIRLPNRTHLVFNHLTDMRNNYLKAHVLFAKNMKKLNDPRGDGEGKTANVMSMF